MTRRGEREGGPARVANQASSCRGYPSLTYNVLPHHSHKVRNPESGKCRSVLLQLPVSHQSLALPFCLHPFQFLQITSKPWSLYCGTPLPPPPHCTYVCKPSYDVPFFNAKHRLTSFSVPSFHSTVALNLWKHLEDTQNHIQHPKVQERYRQYGSI